MYIHKHIFQGHGSRLSTNDCVILWPTFGLILFAVLVSFELGPLAVYTPCNVYSLLVLFKINYKL